MKPSRRERARQRSEILQAALTLFTEKGYHSVTMHEIAERSEFAVGTLYKFFSNKEDLYRVLILNSVDDFQRTISEAIDRDEDEVEKLKDFIRTKEALFRIYLPIFRLYLSETYCEGYNMRAGLDAEVRRRRDVILGRLTRVFEEGIRKRRFRKIADPHSLAIALDGMTNAFHFKCLEDSGVQEAKEHSEVILNILFRALVDDPCTDPSRVRPTVTRSK